MAVVLALGLCPGFALANEGGSSGDTTLAAGTLGDLHTQATVDDVRTAISTLSADPTSYTAADKARVEAIQSDFDALSAEDQAILDSETYQAADETMPESGQSYGRILESALWAVNSFGTDTSTTLANGTYTTSTNPAVSSESSKGKSDSSRVRNWWVESVVVENGQATANIYVTSGAATANKLTSYPSVWIGGQTIDRAADNTYPIPIDLNGTTYFGGVSSSMPTPIMYALDTTIAEPESIELAITNTTTMFKAVTASAVANADGSATLIFALSGTGYHYLYKGTYEQAVANGDAIENWVAGYQNAAGKWEFRIPVAADELGSDVPVVAVSQSYYEKYLSGQNSLERAFFPRQFNLDLEKSTLTTGDFETTKHIAVTNNVKMFKPCDNATLDCVGGPNSNNYKADLVLPMQSATMTNVFVGTYDEAVAATESIAFDTSTATDAQAGTFTIPVKWVAKFGDPTTVVNLANGEPFYMTFKSSKGWYERIATLDEEAGTLKFDPSDADYTAVDAAKAEAAALSEADYAPYSWAALQEAINAVVAGKFESQQAEVDAMAEAINSAIAALVPMPQDGKFSIENNVKMFSVDTTKEAAVSEDGTTLSLPMKSTTNYTDAFVGTYAEANATTEAIAINDDKVFVLPWASLGSNEPVYISFKSSKGWYERIVTVNFEEAKLVFDPSDADYTAVNAAKDAAAALNEDDYTASSWAALQEALAAVETGKFASQQAEVDAMAEAINSALNALAKVHTLTIEYKYEKDGKQAAAPYVQKYNEGAAYDVPVPTIAGYEAKVNGTKVDFIRGTMGDKDVTITVLYSAPVVQHTLTIKYNYGANGKQAANPYVQKYDEGAAYNVPIPAVVGYDAKVNDIKASSVKGTMGKSDVTVQVFYWPAVPDGKGKSSTHRLAGDTALDTMAAIVNAGGFPTGGTVVLTTSTGYWDALTAAGIAGKANAPVIMTDGKSLSAQTKSLIQKLKPTKIIICGGTAAVTKAVENQATAAAGGKSNVVRCAGDTATGTACKIFDEGKKLGAWSNTAFVCTNDGYWDALAAAPISYASGMPIFLTEGKSAISTETLNTMKKGGVSSVYIVGGPVAISDNVRSQIEANGIRVVGRFAGADSIETSQLVAQFGIEKMHMTPNYMGVATTDGYWDALAGAALCGSKGSVLVLANGPQATSVTSFMKKYSGSIADFYIFGGTAAVSKATENAAETAAK